MTRTLYPGIKNKLEVHAASEWRKAMDKSKDSGIHSKFLNRKLYYKISAATGTMLAIFLILLVIISSTLAANFLNRSIKSEFEGIAAQNGVIVQNVLTTATNCADILQDYIVDKYAEFEKSGYNGRTQKSSVYDVQLQEMNKQIEEFLISVARTTTTSNDKIAGVGVFFEPNAFDPSIKDYTIYVSEKNPDVVQSYGAYSTYGSQDYYKQAATSKTNSFTDPYYDQGINMISASFPIVYKNTTYGVVLVNIDIDAFDDLNSSNPSYPSMYVDVLSSDSTMVYDSESTEYIGQRLSDLISAKEYAKIQKGIDTGKSFSVSTKKNDGTNLVRFYSPINACGQTWWAASALSKADLSRNTVILVLLMVAISLATLACIVIISRRLTIKYLKPMGGVVDVANELAEGNFSVNADVVYKDEIGELTQTFSNMSSRLREIIADITHGLNEMASGNFNLQPQVEHIGDFKAIEDALVTVVTDLSNTLAEINEVADMVSANASQLSDGAQSITEGATDQASSVEELQSTIETVSEQVNKNAENANTANDMAKVVGTDIMASNEDMQQVVQAMDTINEAAKQISGIINTINDIASQTNLLALNASIEAARAGDEGRGFAVVATQVGNLAAQSAAAAKSSNDLIVQALNAVEAGKHMVDETAAKLIESVNKTNTLVDNIGAISKASAEQADALNQISQAANQIAAVVQENTAMAEESSASSEELAAQAEKLKNLVSAFKLLEK